MVEKVAFYQIKKNGVLKSYLLLKEYDFPSKWSASIATTSIFNLQTYLYIYI